MSDSTEPGTPPEPPVPEVDALVAELRARVEERRQAGAYPPGLEEDLSEHFRRILRQRSDAAPPPDLQGPLAAAERALPLQASRIPADSAVPGGQALHRTIARIIGRQTQGVLEQVQNFAQPAWQTLSGIVTALDDLSRAVHVDIARHLDAIYERQAAVERAIALAAAGGGIAPAPRDAAGRRPVFQPWYSAERFDEEFRGSRESMLARYRDLAERLVGCDPVLDVGCGRGEILELLAGLGVESWGVDTNEELVKAAAERNLPVQHGEGLCTLGRLEEASLGGLVLFQVLEHLEPQDLVDLVALAAEKVRPGGRVLVETVNPQSLYVFAHSFYLDPTHVRPVHPAYLTFLFREAGFSRVEIEWRGPPPADDVLQPAQQSADTPEGYNENVRRLNQLLFAPQDYLVSAVR